MAGAADRDDDRATPREYKKKLESAAKLAALIGKTNDELLANVFLAAIVNRAAGGAVVAPWEVQRIPDEWLEACTAATVGMERWQQLKKAGGIG